MEQRQPFLNGWVLAAISLFIFMLPELLLAPMFSDHGIYMQTARAFLRGDGLPGVGVWEQKGPFFHFIFAAAVQLGNGFAAVRLLDAALLVSGLAVITALTRPLAGWAGAGVAALLWLLFSSSLYAWGAQPDLWGAHLMLLMVLLLQRPWQWRFLAAGTLLGAATMMKLPFVLFALPLLVAWVQQERTLKQATGAVAGGLVAPVLIGLIYYQAGQLQALLDVYLRYNLAVHAAPLDPERLGLLMRFTLGSEAVFRHGGSWSWLWELSKWGLAAAALAGSWRLYRMQQQLALPLLAGLAAGYLYAFIPARYFGSHMFPMLGFAVILAAPFLLQWRGALLVLLVVKGSSFVLSGNHYELAGWSYMQGGLSRVQYEATHDYDIYDAAAASAAAATVQQLTADKDRVLVWGFYAVVNELSGRAAPTRFVFNYPLRQESRWQARWREEYMAALAAHPPALVLVQHNDAKLLRQLSSRDELAAFPAFQQWLTQHYSLQQSDSFFDYWVSRSQ